MNPTVFEDLFVWNVLCFGHYTGVMLNSGTDLGIKKIIIIIMKGIKFAKRCGTVMSSC